MTSNNTSRLSSLIARIWTLTIFITITDVSFYMFIFPCAENVLNSDPQSRLKVKVKVKSRRKKYTYLQNLLQYNNKVFVLLALALIDFLPVVLPFPHEQCAKVLESLDSSSELQL